MKKILYVIPLFFLIACTQQAPETETEPIVRVTGEITSKHVIEGDITQYTNLYPMGKSLFPVTSSYQEPNQYYFIVQYGDDVYQSAVGVNTFFNKQIGDSHILRIYESQMQVTENEDVEVQKD